MPSVHTTKLWATLGGVLQPLGTMHVLQLLPLGKAFQHKAFQQHRPPPGRYMNTSRQPSLGYWESQPTPSKLYGTLYKNVAHHDQGPCKETPFLSGEVRTRLHDFLI